MGAVDAQDPSTTLEVEISGDTVTKPTLSELQHAVPAQQIDFFNPLMAKDKSYRAFPLPQLFDFLYGDRWRTEAYSDLAFRALDGYEAVSNLDILDDAGAYLAFEDLDQEIGWEPVGRNNADPGPFFLVWTEKHQTATNAYPWPWQVVALDLLRFEDRYPNVVPEGASPDSPVYRGFEIFRARCLRCHAMDQQGGKIGPDLHAPQSIVSYRSEDMIKAYIRQPSKFRYTHMPDHTDLDDRDMDDLYRYFQHQDKHRAQ